jgi:alpha-L-fucosidase 2
MEYRMDFARPAEEWINALPLSNGRLGAMVYGHTSVERIQLNEDSLWYGKAMDRNNPRLKDALPEIRRRVFAGEILQAEDLLQRYMVGAPYSMGHYESLGELNIGVNRLSPFAGGWAPNSDGVTGYRQELDLMRGVHTLRWEENGVHYVRETFVSHPDQALCLRVRADKPRAIQLSARIDRGLIFEGKVPDPRRPGKMIRAGGWGSMFLAQNHTLDGTTLLATGDAGGTRFAAAVCMVSDGVVTDPYTQLYTEGASCVCLYLAAATDNREPDPAQAALTCARKAAATDFDVLLARHIADFEPLMRRSELQLGPQCDLPFDERLARAKQGEPDPGLAALYYTHGRYLLASSGRADSSALNLQGVWCRDFAPMWDSKYTTNINLQMNYWLAEVGNLSETHDSLFSLIRAVCERGRETARVMYGMRGSVCHHNTDYYGDCAPQDQYMAATSWALGGAWMAMHLWEHYLYTRDLEFLHEWRPIMREFAIFFVDFLTDDGTGKQVTCPSLSPENRYILPDGNDSPICAGPAMDNQILRDLFAACVEADTLLDARDEWTEAFAGKRALLPQDQVGSQGQLLEWREELPEKMPGMGHISHLYGAYPSSQMNLRDTPALMAAVARSLQLREANGTDGGGWPLAWRICEYARLQNGQKVGEGVDSMVAQAAQSLLNGHFVFQIDGNLGTAAGIAEALLQSHDGIIRLLPALPPAWREGAVTGLVARGAVTVDMRWANGKLTYAALTPTYAGPINVGACQATGALLGESPVACEQTKYGLRFEALAGRTYTLCLSM